MSANHQLNGSDYLMLSFDHEMRRHGFAGNSCHILLELASSISAETLRARVAELQKRYPILTARPGGLIQPRWKLGSADATAPAVRVHRDEADIVQRLCNERLNINHGELARFDLIECSGGKLKLLFTWAHALMDATSAEHFLALVGNPEIPSPAAESHSRQKSDLPFSKRCKLAWKNLYQIDKFCEAPPRSLGTRHKEASHKLCYRVEKFSTEETARVKATATRLCGVLGAAQYHAAVAILELHALHQKLGQPTPSYVLPVPVGLRPKGSIEPFFSNQLTMLMTQFLPQNLKSISEVIGVMQKQTMTALRDGLIESSRLLTGMFRFLPLPLYMAILKQGLRGEICSLFYGDTAAVSPFLKSFMGVAIEEFTHIAAITPSPGVGVIFYYFGGNLRVTVLHLNTTLSTSEASEFAAGLRARLLNP